MGSITDQQCSAVFGVRSKLCVSVSFLLCWRVPHGTKPKHLILVLASLKLLEFEEAFSTRVHAD